MEISKQDSFLWAIVTYAWLTASAETLCSSFTRAWQNSSQGNLKALLTKDTKSKIAALMVMKNVKEFKKKVDYSEYGGALYLVLQAVTRHMAHQMQEHSITLSDKQNNLLKLM